MSGGHPGLLTYRAPRLSTRAIRPSRPRRASRSCAAACTGSTDGRPTDQACASQKSWSRGTRSAALSSGQNNMASGTRVIRSTPGIMPARRSAHSRPEEDVRRAPRHLCRRGQLGEQRFDGAQLGRRRLGEEVAPDPCPGRGRTERGNWRGARRAADRRAHTLPEPDFGARRAEVTRHGGHQRPELARLRQLHEGLEGLGREVVVHVAVRQRQRADPLGVPGREDLGHGAAGVVGDDVDLVEAEVRAELIELRGESVEGQVGPGRRHSAPGWRRGREGPERCNGADLRPPG